MKKVIFMHEGAGLYTKGFKDKQEAVKAIREKAEHEKSCDESYWEDHFNFDPEDITNVSVEETRYTLHRACGMDTIGDLDGFCYDCGERESGHTLTGRPTFAFFAR